MSPRVEYEMNYYRSQEGSLEMARLKHSPGKPGAVQQSTGRQVCVSSTAPCTRARQDAAVKNFVLGLRFRQVRTER